MTHFLITGGAGFIGSHVAEYLTGKTDHSVTVLDNLLTGSTRNLEHFKSGIRFIEGDITDSDLLNKLLPEIDYVIHQAALPSVPRSVSDPEKSNWNNVNGTLKLLIASRDNKVKRVVAASSSSVYGSNPTLPKVETLPTSPKSPYALTKLAGEYYCRMFTELYGLETVSLRYFNVFGPRQNPNSQYAAVIPLFICNLLDGNAVTIHGDGEQTRDFTYVANVVQANIKACFAPDASGMVFNIGCQDRTSINDLYKELSRLTGVTATPSHTETRAGDVKHSLADIESAKTVLGYNPAVSLSEGLAHTVSYFKNLQG